MKNDALVMKVFKIIESEKHYWNAAEKIVAMFEKMKKPKKQEGDQ